VTSSLAASALSRRYLLGPLIALALVGANPGGTPSGGVPAGSSTASPSPATAVAVAGRVLKLGHDAEGIYYVDNLVYAAGTGEELKSLQGIEPNVMWGKDVIVELPAAEGASGEVLILRAPIAGGGSLCMSEVSEVQDAGTYFSRVAGAAHCPGRKPGMGGWTQDEKTGWSA